MWSWATQNVSRPNRWNLNSKTLSFSQKSIIYYCFHKYFFSNFWILKSLSVWDHLYWSGLPCPPPGDLPNPGIEPRSPALQADSLSSEPPGKPILKANPSLFLSISAFPPIVFYTWQSLHILNMLSLKENHFFHILSPLLIWLHLSISLSPSVLLFLSSYIHTERHVCIYVHTHVCVHKCAHIYVIYIHTHTYIQIDGWLFSHHHV